MLNFLAYLAGSISEDLFFTKNTCTCDVTDKCDQYCCCDTDCNQSSIDQFKQYYCIPQSYENKKIVCDTKNVIDRSNVESFEIPGKELIKCYYVNDNLGDKIKQYTPEEFGLTDFASTLQRIPLPITNSTKKPIYIPIGVGSASCNARVAVNATMVIDTWCGYRTSIKNSMNAIGDEYNSIIDVSVPPIDNAVVFQKDGIIKIEQLQGGGDNTINLKINTYGNINTSKNGYQSGTNLAYSEIGVDHTLQINGADIPFGSNVKFFTNDKANVAFSNTRFCPTYGCLSSMQIDLPAPNASTFSKIVYTLFYRRTGPKTAFTYEFEKVLLTEKENGKSYFEVEINQIQLNEAGNAPISDEPQTLYQAHFYMIFKFMFESRTLATKTTAVLAIAVIAIFTWIVYNVYE